jgi:hypothetical protein
VKGASKNNLLRPTTALVWHGACHGKPEAAQAALTHTRTEALEDGSGDASAGRNSVEDNEETPKHSSINWWVKACLLSLIAI